MIDGSHINIHPHAAGADRRQSRYEPYKRGLNTKIHLAVDACGVPIRFIVTKGTRADCTQASTLILWA
ncbi:transposase [Candidatus Vondammii sp. HM_W22]|uniref:transposase n=1 Tax=Candidatus Vondammii sp. HM_W22 TaxID=2687299 RepID=UPI00403DF134